ncbi:MAG: hypothetical protein FD131_4597 [Rhodocyclaceae bacterium]|nr:MAG: hypothetical protein FD131_4597 [Rhodocyclaceae bacterium]
MVALSSRSYGATILNIHNGPLMRAFPFFGNLMLIDFIPTLTVSHSQIAVFSRCLENPYNDWQDQHVAQGFAWREHSVSFRTLNEFGPCLIEIGLSDHHPPSNDVIRSIRVPFTVQDDGQVEIASIGDSAPLSITPGPYSLLFQILGVSPEGTEKIRLTFARKEPLDFAIIQADEQIQADVPLCLTATVAC